MESAHNVTLWVSFWAGVASFVSPCVLPLIPSYISYITGVSFEELTRSVDEERRRIRNLTITNSLSFILGFSVVFIFLFGLSSSLLGQALFDYRDQIRYAGGALIIFFGLYVMGVIKLRFLMQERKLHLHEKPAGLIGSFVVGVTFAAAWTPCVGPILGSIFLLSAGSSTSLSQGLSYLAAYSLGLALPFFITSLAINSFLTYFKKIHHYMRVVSVTSGVLLILVGVGLLTDTISLVSNALVQWTGFGGI